MNAKKLLIFIGLTFLLMDSFSSYSNTVFQEAKGDSAVAKNNIISLNLLQLYVGELRLSFENQRNEKKYRIYGIGLMYMTNRFMNKLEDFTTLPLEICSDYFYGFKLFYGNKYFFDKNFYISYLTFFKFEKDYNLDLPDYCTLDRYASIMCGGSEWEQFVSYRNKYVLGTKLLFGVQNSMEHKIISDFYFGLGLRFKISDYPYSIVKFDLPYITKGFIVPSVHIGYSFGYNLRRK